MKIKELNIQGKKVEFSFYSDGVIGDKVFHADTGEGKATLFYLLQANSEMLEDEDISRDDNMSSRLLYNIYEKQNNFNESFDDPYEVINPIMQSVGRFLPQEENRLWTTIINSNTIRGEKAIDLLKNRKTIPAMIAVGMDFTIHVDDYLYQQDEDSHDQYIERFLGNLVENIPASEGDLDASDKRIDLSTAKIELSFDFREADNGFTEILIDELQKNGAPIFMVMCHDHGAKKYSITNTRTYADKFDSAYAGFMLAQDYLADGVFKREISLKEAEDVSSLILSKYNKFISGEIYHVVSEEIDLSKDSPHIQNEGNTEYLDAIVGYAEAKKLLLSECLECITEHGDDPAESQYKEIAELVENSSQLTI